jgi:hypothetical protein
LITWVGDGESISWTINIIHQENPSFFIIALNLLQLFNDPIHGSIELHPLLAEIVKMRAFTRLKNVRQLGNVRKLGNVRQLW